VYRLAALVVPFAAWALVGVAADRLPLWGRLVMSVPIVWGASRFLREYLLSTGTLERTSGAWPVIIGLSGAALAIVTPRAAPALVRRFPNLETTDGRRRYQLLGHGVTVVFLIAITTASFALARPGWTSTLSIDEPPEPLAHFAKAAGKRLPPGTRMIVPASFEGWRLWSRQPVIADCKGLPYGGKPYHEWLERIVDLYVDARGIGCADHWPLLTLNDIERISSKYDAPVALFITGDPKLEAARRAGWHEVYDTAQFGDSRLKDMAVFRVPQSAS
jgi:hypothetical protein